MNSGARSRSLAAILLVVGALMEPRAARAHGAHQAPSEGEVQVLAPGYGPLAYTAPVPGSYALPPLGVAIDGPVLRSDGSATRLYQVYGDELVLLSFIYASCTDSNGCPLATAVLHKVAARLRAEPELSGRLRLVSLSFDPARDTPELMRRYGDGFVGSGSNWSFLTARSAAELAPVLAAYGQTVVRQRSADGSPAETLSHLLRVFLIDRDKRIRNVYSTSFLHADLLINDVKTLLLEPTAPRDAAPAADPSLPGDDRAGYERASYRTRSVQLAARRGEPADLLGRLRTPQLGLPAPSAPADNPPTAQKVALGRKLFYDRRLSQNGTFSCAMCHIPEQGFTSNELATPIGIEGRTVRRNAPTLYNVGYAKRLFHDARETRLEQQVWGPLLANNEMGNPSIGELIERIRGHADYRGLFESAFPGRGLGMEAIGMALASYERTLVSGDSAFDRWFYGKDSAALGEPAQRGFRLFSGKAACVVCHTLDTEHALFDDDKLHNTGVGYATTMRPASQTTRVQVAPGSYLTLDRALLAQISEPPPGDLGRYEISQDPADRWKYRTPGLRNAALTAPYMHDGSLLTLRDVVAFYDRGGVANEGLDPAIRPLGLSAAEQRDLLAFLESLTGTDVKLLVRDAFAAPIGDVGTAALAR